MSGAAARELLEALHPQGFRDFRAFYADKRSDRVQTMRFPAANLDGATEFVDTYAQLDVYVGVAARADAHSREPARLFALFVDLDFKNSDEASTRARLAAFALPPSAVVCSGGGLQPYWFLDEPIDVKETGGAALARTLLLSLCAALQGDPVSAEAARILRVPGSLNYKYEPARPVALESFDKSRVYKIADFMAAMPILQVERKTQNSTPFSHDLSRDVRMSLAKMWLERQAAAVQGQAGDSHTYSICCSIAHGHDLSPADAFDVLKDWNARCSPPWNDNDLRQKIRSATKSADGPRGQRLQLIVDPVDPMATARQFVARHYYIDDIMSVRHQSLIFYAYMPWAGAYHAQEDVTLRSHVYHFLERAKQWKAAPAKKGAEAATEEEKAKLVPLKPTKSHVENVVDALKAVAHLQATVSPPTWLSHESQFKPLDMMACPNGLLHIPTKTFHTKTPHFYTLNGLDFDYDPYAAQPEHWLNFLHSVWEEDPSSVDTLQEIFGYYLLPDTKLQKIVMLIGEKRSGKGTIGRILRLLVGLRNVCSPTLASFGQPFGKESLIGKTLAIISDARIGGRTDTAMIAEALLSISGEDSQTIPRKYLQDWHGQLPIRFFILTNELPRIADVSGALVSRFILLHLTRSWLGNEDLGLFDKLVPELPGILLWALEGRERLYQRGYLVQPDSAMQLFEEFNELGSPEAAFLTECTMKKPGGYVTHKDLFAAWQSWCQRNGRDRPGSSQMFGRNVRSALPWATTRRLGSAGDQERCWEGLGLIDSVLSDSNADM